MFSRIPLRAVAALLSALGLGAVGAEPQITEFVAINASSLTDGDGKSPDWIEIHNSEVTPLDISGYHLTDDIEIPNLYTFPTGIVIPGGGYLVVFASGAVDQAYTDAAGNLHTNFSLDGDGEYLALTSPNGSTLQAFETTFPRQFENVSYGIGTTASQTTLLAADAAAAWLVPDSDIGSTWQEPNFDASSWQTSGAGIGYGHGELISEGGDTRGAMWFGNPSVYLRVPFEVEDPSTITSLDLHMRYDDGFVAYINGIRVASANAPDEAALSRTATATAERAEDQVTVAQSFKVPASSLQAGSNVLAIHGLNFSSAGANSADFLALPELTATSTDATGTFGYFIAPTPGSTNDAIPLIGFVKDTKFSHDRGYYAEAFELSISTATPGATILYTIDGTPPSVTNGTPYTAPIPIGPTTTLRAIATKAGFQPTNVDTQTYLFVDAIVRQERPSGYPSAWGGGRADYDMDPDIVDHPDYVGTFHEAFVVLPTLSLVFDPDAFFDGSRGIYQRPDGEGINWERPLSAEFIIADDSEPGFQINAGVRIQGGSSRNTDTPKHALSLRFRAEYGTEKLRYPLFKDTPSGETSVDRFDVLQLRPEYNFGWMHRHWYQALYALYGRDQWASDLFNAMGQNGSHGRWVHLFLNGIYWGLYDVHERPDANHMANYFGGSDDDYDTVNSSFATNGDLETFNTLMDLAYGNIESESTYEDIQDYLDIDAFIDYMILNAYVGNRDWDGHNWRAARKREPGAGYLFFPWDTEFAASHVSGGVFDPPPNFFTTALETNITENNGNRRPTGLQQRLERNPEYRLRYADHVRAHFFNQGPLTPEKAAALWTARSATMTKAIVAESARWGDFRRDVSPGRWPSNRFDLYTRNDHYLPVHQWLLETYIPQRSDIVLDQLRDRNLYPKADAPEFSQHGGMVPRGFQLQVDAAATVQYTTDGSDPRLPGGSINPTALTATPGSNLTLNESTRVRARSRSIFGEWSALTEAFFTIGTSDLQISEIMYHPADEPLAEFIELHNTGKSAISLIGLYFSQGITFDFDHHASIHSLAAGARLLIVRNQAAFQAVYGMSHNALIAGHFQEDTALANNGETLSIADANGSIILTITYDNKAPWPATADGEGRSLIFTGSDPSRPEQWRASATINGNPGGEDTAPPIPQNVFAAPLEISRTPSALTLTYTVKTDGNDVSISVQHSSNLQGWVSIVPAITGEQVDTENGTRSVSLDLPPSTIGFVRLVVSN